MKVYPRLICCGENVMERMMKDPTSGCAVTRKTAVNKQQRVLDHHDTATQAYILPSLLPLIFPVSCCCTETRTYYHLVLGFTSKAIFLRWHRSMLAHASSGHFANFCQFLVGHLSWRHGRQRIRLVGWGQVLGAGRWHPQGWCGDGGRTPI